jgi:hypothetical protein
MKRALYIWIPFAIITTLLAILSYILVQQTIRLSANSPQNQLAEEYANELSLGKQPQFSWMGSVDLATSKGLYVIFFDVNRAPVYSTASLDGNIPIPPKGVFQFAKTNGENRLTWQPEDGIRSAIVLTYYSNATSAGYVLVGRSLAESEDLTRELLKDTIIIWICGLIATFLGAYFESRRI